MIEAPETTEAIVSNRATRNKNVYMEPEVERMLNEIGERYAQDNPKLRRGASISQSKVLTELIRREYTRIFGGKS